MNIIEAIKSGRSFRRPSFPADRWFSYDGNSKTMSFYFEGRILAFYHPDKVDILADDWEIEEKKIDITKSQFISIWDENFGGFSSLDRHGAQKILISALGLE